MIVFRYSSSHEPGGESTRNCTLPQPRERRPRRIVPRRTPGEEPQTGHPIKLEMPQKKIYEIVQTQKAPQRGGSTSAAVMMIRNKATATITSLRRSLET